MAICETCGEREAPVPSYPLDRPKCDECSESAYERFVTRFHEGGASGPSDEALSNIQRYLKR